MPARARLKKGISAPGISAAVEPAPATGSNSSRSMARDAARRQRVTLLVADIQSSTALIQHMDPEDAAQALDPALTTMIEAVEYYQGTVSHVRGDGLLAVFGAPSACEDHALRACLAALAILGKGPPPLPTPLRVRIGIHSGEVVLRHVRYRKGHGYDAVGVAVHLAARLEETAAPNSACMSAATVALVRGFMNVERLEPIIVKGIDQPIMRFQLISANSDASRWDVRKEATLRPFVGRTNELAILAKLLTDAKNTVQGVAGGVSKYCRQYDRSAGSRRATSNRSVDGMKSLA
jgi:class 3 adenylate cyclase